jgi:hypothetical protein
MSFDALGDMNWLAVIVATVAYFALGGLWFSKLMFANAWQRAMGWEETEEESYGPEFYIGPFVTCLLSTIGVGMLAVATGSDTLAEGLVLGLVVGVGVSAAVLFVTGYFDQRKPQPMVWVAVTAGYHLVGLLAASAILSTWT